MQSFRGTILKTLLWLGGTGWKHFDPDLDPAVWRRRMNTAADRVAKLPKDVSLSTITAGGVPAEWVELPESRSHRVILYLHGGGYVYGSPSTHREMVARICRAAQARALIIDYRLAPEYPCPAAVHDSVSAYRWLISSGLDPRGIVIAGDSAGGGLMLSTLMALRDRGDPMPAAGIGLSPWTDLAQTGWSTLQNQKTDPMLSMHMLAYCAFHYLNERSPTDPAASPLYGDFKGLPPLLLHVAKGEILLDDSTRLMKRAAADGVDVSLEEFDSPFHVFHIFPFLPEAKRGVDRLGKYIKSRTIDSQMIYRPLAPAAQ